MNLALPGLGIEPRATWAVITGDCREVMRGMPGGYIQHTITDPPYDKATHASGRTGFRPDSLPIDFEPLADLDFVTDALRLTLRWTLAFCSLEMLGDYRRAAGDRWVRAGFWYRPDGQPQFTGDRPAQPGEGIAIMHSSGRKLWNGGGHKAFWSHCVEHSDRVHPTQKPISLMLEIVEKFTSPGDIVLDPFCGSGTTGVACLRLGRRFIGIESDPKYATVARERLAAEARGVSLAAARAGQESLFS